jgi:diphthine-ammonia ligase
LNGLGNLCVKLAALFSGGKDSTFAIYRAKEMGHQVACLITMHPIADDSPLFHYPNSRVTEYLSNAMQTPLIGSSVGGRTKENEANALEGAIMQAKSVYGIEGIVHGGISSSFQKNAFEEICGRLKVAAIAPLWDADPQEYMGQLIERSFSIIIVGVSAMGLGKEWLGRQIDVDALGKLAALATKYGFNLTFEGGEAETLVVDCPLFRKKLRINASTLHWDGQRGMFEIQDASLVDK